jgi:putative endonuclease
VTCSDVEANWVVYIVRCADETLYTGIAKDIGQRIAKHNEGTGAAYTRARRPVVLVHQEPAADRGAALRREAAIKRLPVAAKRALAGG